MRKAIISKRRNDRSRKNEKMKRIERKVKESKRRRGEDGKEKRGWEKEDDRRKWEWQDCAKEGMKNVERTKEENESR